MTTAYFYHGDTLKAGQKSGRRQVADLAKPMARDLRLAVTCRYRADRTGEPNCADRVHSCLIGLDSSVPHRDVLQYGPCVTGDGAHAPIQFQRTTNNLSIASYNAIRTSTGDGNGNFSCIALSNEPAASANANGYVLISTMGTSHFGFALAANLNSSASATSGSLFLGTYNGGWVGVAAASKIDGNWHVFGGRRTITGATCTLDLFVDGALAATATGLAIKQLQDAGPYNAIGNRGQDEANSFIAGSIGFGYAWDRALADREFEKLAHPYAAQRYLMMPL